MPSLREMQQGEWLPSETHAPGLLCPLGVGRREVLRLRGLGGVAPRLGGDAVAVADRAIRVAVRGCKILATWSAAVC